MADLGAPPTRATPARSADGRPPCQADQLAPLSWTVADKASAAPGGAMQLAEPAGRDAFAWSLIAYSVEIPRWRGVAAEAVTKLGGDPNAVSLTRLAVTELICNVAKHVADPHCRLAVAREGDRFRVSVRDRSLRVPAVTVPAWDAESGRGLWLLREMAPDWGYTLLRDGKEVWFRYPLGGVGEVPLCAGNGDPPDGRRAFRFREHTVAPDRGPDAEPWVSFFECVVCRNTGPKAGTSDDALAWTLEHLKRYPGHLSFREHVSRPYRAVPGRWL